MDEFSNFRIVVGDIVRFKPSATFNPHIGRYRVTHISIHDAWCNLTEVDEFKSKVHHPADMCVLLGANIETLELVEKGS